MTTIHVKPAPGLDPAAAKVLRSDTGLGLLDAAGNVPELGMPWPNGGLTLVLLRDGVIVRAEPAPAIGFTAWAAGHLAGQEAAPAPTEPTAIEAPAK